MVGAYITYWVSNTFQFHTGVLYCQRDSGLGVMVTPRTLSVTQSNCVRNLTTSAEEVMVLEFNITTK